MPAYSRAFYLCSCTGRRGKTTGGTSVQEEEEEEKEEDKRT